MGLIIIIVLIIIACICGYIAKRDVDNNLKRYDEEQEFQNKCTTYIKEKYVQWLLENNITIPNNAIQIGGKYDAYSIKPTLLWKDNDDILICQEPVSVANNVIYNLKDDIKRYEEADYIFNYYKIPANQVKFYKAEGELIAHTNITGGQVSGGGSSLKGAVVGGVLAGDVGAVIGSRKKIDSTPIKSHTTYDDKRAVNVYLESEDGVNVEQFPYAFYEAFNKLMPEKNYDYLVVRNKI